jgi:16S rRNA (cytidine1402-2'-O)-methyltransferase
MRKLILLPNLLHETSDWSYTTPQIDALIAESDKGGYTYLKRFGYPKVPIYLLNEHTNRPEELLNITQERVGLISDAGLPCLADPGSQLVAGAKAKGIEVEAVPGPSSLIMALQLSGFSGQTFSFHGYFPRGELDIIAKVRGLPKGMALMFIETPYRTEKVFKVLQEGLQARDQMCVALELMGPEQFVETHTIADWKQIRLPLEKGRAVFVISRAL